MAKKNQHQISHENLFSIVAKKDRDAYNNLYNQYCGILYGIALKSVECVEYAEEIVQLTFLKVWNGIEEFHSQNCSSLVWMVQLHIDVITDFLDIKMIDYYTDKDGFPKLKKIINEK